MGQNDRGLKYALAHLDIGHRRRIFLDWGPVRQAWQRSTSETFLLTKKVAFPERLWLTLPDERPKLQPYVALLRALEDVAYPDRLQCLMYEMAAAAGAAQHIEKPSHWA